VPLCPNLEALEALDLEANLFTWPFYIVNIFKAKQCDTQ